MLHRIRTYAREQHLALLCLFLILGGGTAWAALANDSVKSKHIKDGQVKEADLGAAAVTNAKVAADAIDGSKVGSNALGTADIDESTLYNDNSLNGADVNESTLYNDDSLNEADLAAAEAPHVVGAGGEPGFAQNDGFCPWQNFDGAHQQAAFYRDAFGVVHIQGLVKATDNGCDFPTFDDELIFTLPAGYRPALRSVHANIANNNLGRINIDPDGGIRVDPSLVSVAAAAAFVSLEGITFRCSPAGSNGCP